MIRFSEQEVKIVRELIKNPRSSDNSIAKKTGVPVMTVNRKRKQLETKNIIRYFTSINNEEEGTGLFHARQLYILKFKTGITREFFIDRMKEEKELVIFNAEHIVESYVGEKDGHLAMMMILDAKTEPELVECFNGKIIPFLENRFGKDSVVEVTTFKLNIPFRLHHNYLPLMNMELGKIKEGWPDEWIFVE